MADNKNDKRDLDGRILNAHPDIPDFRDRPYQPALLQLKQHISPPADLEILDQQSEGACTGFGLAAVINKLNYDRNSSVRVSTRMLYHMAKKFDEWPGESYDGSSCRGAIKGWYSMGVCSESKWPYQSGNQDTRLTVERAKDARNNTIGAYCRVAKNIVDMHAAMNEVGAVFVSADVHVGWKTSAIKDGVIKQSNKIIGGHAFAIVGYNEQGFWVQNSWGPSWGRDGLALWPYEDWKANVRDAWVFSVALTTPQLWGGGHGRGAAERDQAGFFSRDPRRDEIAGHFVHIDDGEFDDTGKYWSTEDDVEQTAGLLCKSKDYDHVLIYAHGGLNSPEASASRIAAMKETFKTNRIYPYHFMYDTGLLEELKDLIIGKKSEAEQRVGGISDWSDWVLERLTRRPGRAIWREMKSDAELGFEESTKAGWLSLKALVGAAAKAGAAKKKIHMVGHSTGAILLAHALRALSKMRIKTRIASVSLLAPAATVELYKSHYQPLLTTKAGKFGIDKLNIYNLDDEQELDDQVATAYRKSLLYLVSNAFEEKQPAAILGMQKYSEDLPANRRLKLIYSKGKRKGSTKTESETHGGFDNDPDTMNDILKTVLGGSPKTRFTDDNLKY
jgi:hypothetical protein